MRLAIVTRDVRFLRPIHTTTHLARAALEAGWSVHLLGVGELTLGSAGETVSGTAVRLRAGLSARVLCHRLLEDELPRERIDLRACDLVLLRFNPTAKDPFALDWTHWWPALQAAQRLSALGVPVVNEPGGLLPLLTKLHTWTLPPEATLGGLITRTADEVERYQESLGGLPLILKPLSGSGGNQVFLLDPHDRANRDQIFETLFSAGYALAQPFLAEGLNGDLRVLLLDGEPLTVQGHVALYRRRGRAGRVRNNIHAGGRRVPATLEAQDERTLALIGPQLRAAGLRFVGVDLLGGRVLEVNAFCPGGIENINALYGIDVAPLVIEGLARPAR